MTPEEINEKWPDGGQTQPQPQNPDPGTDEPTPLASVTTQTSEAVEPAAPEATPPPESNSPAGGPNKKMVVMAGVVVVLLLLAAIGAFAFMQMRPAEQAPFTPGMADEIDPTADWEAYVNEEYGFQILYPLGWGLNETNISPEEVIGIYPNASTPIAVIKKDNDNFISFEFETGLKTDSEFSNYVSSKNKENNYNYQPYSLNGINGYLKNFQVENRKISNFIFLKGGKVVVMTFGQVADDLSGKRVLDQMLSTFQFIDPPLVDEFIDNTDNKTSCVLVPDPGLCRAAIERYYFNQSTGKCEAFTWGGCGGVVPFDTLSACQADCEN